jgi:hypothetical protein
MVAWVLASFVAGMVLGVAAMARVVRDAERERDAANFPRSFLTFGPESPAARSRVPGHAASDAEPPTATLTAPTPLHRGALDRRMGRTGAQFALGMRDSHAAPVHPDPDRRNP